MIRRFLTRILMTILIAACGYNAWQVNRLQGQVRWLQSRAAASEGRNGRNVPKPVSPVGQSWLDQADLHAGRARAAVMRADIPTAQRELLRGVDDVHHAVREPEMQTETKFQKARQTLVSLQSQADSLWRKAHAVHPGP